METKNKLTYKQALDVAIKLCLEKNFTVAEKQCKAILAHKPDSALALSLMGLALGEQDKHDEAIPYYNKAIKLNSTDPVTFYNRGNSLHKLNQFEQAAADYQKAVSLRSNFTEAYYNCGDALQSLNKFSEAVECYDQAILLDPNHYDAHLNRGHALSAQIKHKEAMQSYDKALAARPDKLAVEWAKSNVMLCYGVSELAWQLYEYRFFGEFYEKLPTYNLPLLGTINPVKKKLLVQWEHRFGDVIQMLRYVPLLEEVAECYWQIDKSLTALVTRSYPTIRIIEKGTCVDGLDCRVPFTSLPLTLQTFSEEAIPNKVPYLISENSKISYWDQQLPKSSSGLRVGLVWRGKPHPPNRSATLKDFLPFLSIPQITFVSLQKELTQEEQNLLAQHKNVVALDAQLDTFDETAAVMGALDLVISIDSALTHLAGALGRPTWVLLKYDSDWRWLMSRSDSPWYPSVQLFRQSTLGDWSGSIQDMMVRLQAQIEAI